MYFFVIYLFMFVCFLACLATNNQVILYDLNYPTVSTTLKALNFSTVLLFYLYAIILNKIQQADKQ